MSSPLFANFEQALNTELNKNVIVEPPLPPRPWSLGIRSYRFDYLLPYLCALADLQFHENKKDNSYTETRLCRLHVHVLLYSRGGSIFKGNF